MSAELRGQWCFGALGGESGTTVGFMEVFSTDLRPCLPPRWLRPWNSPSPSWLVMGTLVLPYTLLLAEKRKYWWQLLLLLLAIWFSFYQQHFLWNAECIWRCILYKLGNLILGDIYLMCHIVLQYIRREAFKGWKGEMWKIFWVWVIAQL